MNIIRKATEEDIPRMVELSELKRQEYEKHQPLFWKKSKDSAEKQTAFFKTQLSKENIISFVHEDRGNLDGFIIALLVSAPPVYDPGGPTCLIDDFALVGEGWKSTGRFLLEKVQKEAFQRGAVQSAVFCGHQDQSKREMLLALGFSIANETYVKPIQD
jgi:hypothetical protein